MTHDPDIATPGAQADLAPAAHPAGAARPSAAQFAQGLRNRAEEAVAASVHHASLSQQYLVLSQKLAALAEHAGRGTLGSIAELTQFLDLEAATGAPAPPMGLLQVAWPWSHPDGTASSSPAPAAPGRVPDGDLASRLQREMPQPETAEPKAQDVLSDGSDDRVRQNSEAPGTGAAPTSGVAAGETAEDVPTAESHAAGAATDQNKEPKPEEGIESPQTPAPQTPAPATSADSAAAAAVRAPGKAPGNSGRRRHHRPRRIRELAERIRLVAPQILDRVRIRAKKSDLKPPVRTAVEEIRRSRNPVLCSSLLLVVALLVLALIQLEIEISPAITPIMASFADAPAAVEESLPVEPPHDEVGEQLEQETPEPIEEPAEPEEPPADEMAAEAEESESSTEPEVADAPLPEVQEGTRPSAVESSAATASVDGRTAAGRQQMLQKYGGSAASESSVQLALEWLASRQRRDGSWDFADIGACSHPGSIHNPIGGTAWAVLPFLAAGQTHTSRDSIYRRNLEAGLAFLMSAGIQTPAGLDLRGVLNKGSRDQEPNEAYYVHGAATLALCEAYAMTKDRRLRSAAEAAVRFIVNSQDPRGGGWRYLPQQAGSTSATATQVMALMAARKAKLTVPQASLDGVMHYLDSIQVDDEGRYGYELEKKTYQVSVTAMALLSRMYLWWGRDDGNLRGGIALLDRRGPYDNLYYNYFATQVLRNWGGAEWERWNSRLRDDLISWQESQGEARGSWTPRDRDDYSRAGGRLLTTCLATLTLEVYYRYQPILSESAAGAVAGPAASGSEVSGSAASVSPASVSAAESEDSGGEERADAARSGRR